MIHDAFMNRLTTEKRAQILGMLVEGTSIRAVTRLTGVSKNTVAKLIRDVGDACQAYHDAHVRELSCKRVQCDEIWSFVYAKQRNIPEHLQGQPGIGDVWTWTAIDADTKLAVSWLVGGRDAEYAKAFMHDVASRLANRVQLTTDGHGPYLVAVEEAFGAGVDFAQLVKLYGVPPSDGTTEARYSPPRCVGARKERFEGKPDPKHISTSYVERQNLTMRMHMRRFTRLTNAFSKKIENHAHAVAIHFMYYNFVRLHKSLRVTPAMAAGVTDRLWEISDIVALVQAKEAEQLRMRGPYSKTRSEMAS
jgi:IS1 family transposase